MAKESNAPVLWCGRHFTPRELQEIQETFVDPEKYRGTSYQAANWILLGRTAGRGRMDRYKEYLLTPKLIYAYPLVADFRAHLCREGRADE